MQYYYFGCLCFLNPAIVYVMCHGIVQKYISCTWNYFTFCMKTNFSHYYRELLNSAPFLKCTSFTGNSCIPPLNSTNTTNLGAGIDLQVKQAASQKRHDLY